MQLAGYEVRQDLLPAKREPISLSQEINKIALTTQLFFSKSSQGFRSISSQMTPYGAPPEVFVFWLCQLYNETGRPGFPDLLILFMDFSFTNTKYD